MIESRVDQLVEDARRAIKIHDGVLALKAERDALRSLVHQLGAKAVYVRDNLQDEGDRVYLGSTNHADVLEKAKQLYDEYRLETGDMGPDNAI